MSQNRDRHASRSKQAMHGAKRHGRGGGKSDMRGGGARINVPKWDDQPEAADMKAALRVIEQKIKAVQSKVVHAKGEVARAARKTKHQEPTFRRGSRAHHEKRAAELERRCGEARAEASQFEDAARQQSVVAETRKGALTKVSDQLLIRRKKGEKDEDFVRRNIEAIDERVVQLEADLGSQSMEITEEKALMREIKRVRNLRSILPAYVQRSEEYGTEARQVRYLERKAEGRKELAERLETERERHLKAIADLDAKAAEAEDAAKEAADQVAEVAEVKEGHEAELAELVRQLQAQEEAIRETREAWYAARRQAAEAKREATALARIREREERAAEAEARKREAREERKQLIPFLEQIDTLRVLLTFVDQLNPAGAPATEAAAAAEADADAKDAPVTLPEGARIVGKGANEEEDFFGGRRQKKRGGGGGKRRARKQTSKGVVINVATLSQFSKIKVNPPTSVADCPKVREELAAKLAEFEAKSKTERAKVLAQIEAEEAAEAAEAKARAQLEAQGKADAAAAADAAADGEEDGAAEDAAAEDADAAAEE